MKSVSGIRGCTLAPGKLRPGPLFIKVPAFRRVDPACRIGENRFMHRDSCIVIHLFALVHFVTFPPEKGRFVLQLVTTGIIVSPSPLNISDLRMKRGILGFNVAGCGVEYQRVVTTRGSGEPRATGIILHGSRLPKTTSRTM
jgi:hypothetical protein